jgi:hypothetical protein
MKREHVLEGDEKKNCFFLLPLFFGRVPLRSSIKNLEGPSCHPLFPLGSLPRWKPDTLPLLFCRSRLTSSPELPFPADRTRTTDPNASFGLSPTPTDARSVL